MKASKRPAPGQYHPVLMLFVSMLAGVTCDRYGSIPAIVWLLFTATSVFGWLYDFPHGTSQHRIPHRGGILILLAVFNTAALWHHQHWRVFGDDEVGLAAQLKPTPICAEVVALGSPRRQPRPAPNPLNTVREQEESHFAVEIVRVRQAQAWRPSSGRAMLRITGQPETIHSGDRLRILGHMSIPGVVLNPGEPDFAEYERAERRLCRLQVDSPDCIRILALGNRFTLTSCLNAIRDHCAANLWRHIHPSRAGLATAVLLGTREQIDRHRNEDFMTTGTVHLLSISGLHVGILVYGFWMITRFGWMSRKKTLVAAIVFVVLYALLTDARPPVVRATVLVSVMCVARFLGREALNLNTLAAAGIVVLTLNPCAFFQTGTQLSFLAVATMAGMPWIVERRASMDPLDRVIAETRHWAIRFARKTQFTVLQATALSTVIWLTSLPLVLFRFHLVSPIATVLNPIVCLPMAIALFAGFGVMVLGGIAPPLAGVCGWICDVSLWGMEECIRWALTWRGNHCWLPAPPIWWIGVFYATIAAWLVGPRIPLARRWACAMILIWFGIGAWLTAGPGARKNQLASRELKCTFIAVGHGTSVLLEFPQDRTILYDAGRLGMASSGARSIAALLWSRGVTHLDAVVISHADADHFNAVPELLSRFSVGVVYVSPAMFRHHAEALVPLRASLISDGIAVRELWAGDSLSVPGQAIVRVLHPPETGVPGSDNANSIVLLVEFDGCRILLPGDLESPGLEDLLRTPALDCHIIMAPHHGSARSNPVGFARWSKPEHVIISGGIGRDARPVKSAFESAGAVVYHTAESGAVQVTVGEGGYQVNTYRNITQAGQFRFSR